MGKTACVSFPMGCYRSMVDAAVLVDYFRLNGWKITTSFSDAEIILIGTCGLSMEAERMSRGFVSIAQRRKNGDTPVVIFGCLAGIAEDLPASKLDVIPITRHSMDILDSIINAEVKIGDVEDPNDLNIYLKYIKHSFSRLDWFSVKIGAISIRSMEKIVASLIFRFNKYSPGSAEYSNLYDIRIGSGCLGVCSYCAIRFETGSLVSKPSDVIMREFHTGLSLGYKVFRLTAEDVGAYGQDIQTNIVGLLRKIFAFDAHFKLIFDDFSPKWFLRYESELLDLIAANQQRIGYLGMPLQSGSERILKLMKRGYSSSKFKTGLTELKRACPDLPIKTHIMVGFPGESELDFGESMDFVKSVPLEMVTIFRYSDRPGTTASDLLDKIPERTVNRRVWALMRAAKFGKATPAL